MSDPTHPHGSACADLTQFLDGELEEERAAAFRAHLPGCEACRAGVVEGAALSERLLSLRGLDNTNR